jgi:hypothetical protein
VITVGLLHPNEEIDMVPAAPWKLVLVSAIGGLAAIGSASAAGPSAACTALTAPDATALMGAPLAANFRNESAPDAVNGHDHTTVCGWFPAGYDLQKADAPPERGVQLTLHTFRTAAEAKQFHDMTKNGPPGGKPKPVAGVGQDAVVEEKTFSGTRVATIRFLKGTHAAQIQTWRKDNKDAAESATAAAKQVVGKL